jgi:hypothetical protein
MPPPMQMIILRWISTCSIACPGSLTARPAVLLGRLLLLDGDRLTAEERIGLISVQGPGLIAVL